MNAGSAIAVGSATCGVSAGSAPSCPKRLSPQPKRRSFVANSEKPSPAATWMILPCARPARPASTVVVGIVAGPEPSACCALLPQPSTVPSSASSSVWLLPAAAPTIVYFTQAPVAACSCGQRVPSVLLRPHWPASLSP